MKPTVIQLDPGDHIIAVVPEYHSGPGWGNSLITVHIETSAGQLRKEYLQPEEQTPEMRVLFAICRESHSALLRAVPTEVKKVQGER